VRATLTRNSFQGNGAHDLYTLAPLPGSALTYVSENGFSGLNAISVLVDGSGNIMHANANTGSVRLACTNNAIIVSKGNNDVDGADIFGVCTINTTPGF
jgi:hypothetical protein